MSKDKEYEALVKKVELMNSGYAGTDRMGNIVDRRENKHAIPLKENAMMGTPKPKKLK